MKNIDEILYGGAKYGGKSWFLCVWAYLFACNFAVEYNIPKSNNPLPIGFLGRKVAKNFSDTTLETWFKTIPADGYVAKGKPVDLIIDDRVKIHTGGLDNRETINKFNSAEYAFFCLDQAEEMTPDDIALLRAATFGRLVVNGKALPGKGLFTANPRACWLKEEFILSPSPARKFVPALPTDNPYCTEKYINNLKDAFKHRPELLRAYLYGDWSAIEGAEQVIKSEWIEEAKLRTCHAPRVKRYLVCDTARFGDDECVIYLMENAEIIGKKILGQSRAPDIVNRLNTLSHQNNDCQIVVEVVGADLGGAVSDYLTKAGRDVIEFRPGDASTYKGPQGKPIYHNLRAEAWSKAATILCSGVLDEESNTVVECKNMYPLLQTQLCTPEYKFADKGGRILVEKKESIKARIGRSPDHADTYVIGLWAWDRVDYAIEDTDAGGYMTAKRTRKKPSPMRM